MWTSGEPEEPKSASSSSSSDGPKSPDQEEHSAKGTEVSRSSGSWAPQAPGTIIGGRKQSRGCRESARSAGTQLWLQSRGHGGPWGGSSGTLGWPMCPRHAEPSCDGAVRELRMDSREPLGAVGCTNLQVSVPGMFGCTELQSPVPGLIGCTEQGVSAHEIGCCKSSALTAGSGAIADSAGSSPCA